MAGGRPRHVSPVENPCELENIESVSRNNCLSNLGLPIFFLVILTVRTVAATSYMCSYIGAGDVTIPVNSYYPSGIISQ